MNAAEHLIGKDALERHGPLVALLCENRKTSFDELGLAVRRAASAWRRLGAQPGDRVLIQLPDTPESAAAWLGALYAGAVAIAVNSTMAADQRFMFEDSAARLFLADTAAQTSARAFAGDACVDTDRWREALACVDPMERSTARRGSDPAFWLYSSGTTGRPKGIVHAHKDVLPCGNGLREVLGLGAGDTVFCTSKLFFAYGLEHGLLGPLALGAASVLDPGTVEARTVSELVARHCPSAFLSVPSFYRRLLTLDPVALAPFASVPHFVAAGERLPAPVLERWKAATGREILSLYGMSETFCVSMMTPPGTADGLRTGTPLAGVDVKLLDESGAESRPDEPGILWIRHPALASGYANRPEVSREQFVQGWFCTKDLFVRDPAGFYCHVGRADEFIKIAGQWVQPAELEEAATADGSITEAACVRVNDADGFERLALFVAAGADADAALRVAAQACEARLPRHKRPKWIRTVSELPRTATGKIQRFKLRELIERELAG